MVSQLHLFLDQLFFEVLLLPHLCGGEKEGPPVQKEGLLSPVLGGMIRGYSNRGLYIWQWIF